MRALRRLPPLSLLPGHSPAQAAKCSLEANTLDVGPDLDQDRGRGATVDAGDGRQQTELLLPRCHLFVDLLGVGRDARLERVMLLQKIVEHEAVVVAQAQ